ncbi:hypothetical protein QQ045_000168 [Rhodiola kirilowii]
MKQTIRATTSILTSRHKSNVKSSSYPSSEYLFCERTKDRRYFQKNDRNKRLFPVVDIADVFRRWTHALEGIQRQSHLLAKANNGEGPELLRRSYYNSCSDHTTFLYATCADHEQHLNNFEVLIHHLINLSSKIQKSVRDCTEQVHTIFFYDFTRSISYFSNILLNLQEISDTDVTEVTPMSSPGKVSVNPPTLKLPQLFSLTSTTAAKGNDKFSVRKLKRSVREAALSRQLGKLGSSRGSQSECGSEHSLTPHSIVRYSQPATEHRTIETKGRHLFETQFTNSLLEEHDADELVFDVNTLREFNNSSELLEDDSPTPTGAASTSTKSLSVIEEPLGEVFSPTLLTDSLLLDDLYEDLLAPLSETETAMMEH